jgi:hypothetical protein
MGSATPTAPGGAHGCDRPRLSRHPSNAWVFEPVRPNAYDLGDVDALRQRPTRARTKAATVTRLRDTQKQRVARGQAAGSCMACQR